MVQQAEGIRPRVDKAAQGQYNQKETLMRGHKERDAMIPIGKWYGQCDEDGVEYLEMDGRHFYRYQTTKGLGRHHLKFRFVSTDSPYDQGIALGFSTDPAFRGKVYLDGLRLARPKKKYEKLVISEGDWLEREFVLDVSIEQGYMTFSNASDTLPDYADLEKLKQVSQQTGIPLERLQQKVYTSGFKDAHRTANGFWIEQLSPSCYRFHCNDHALDDDFDDMILELEVIEAPAKGTEGMEE